MDCNRCVEDLTAFLDGELNAADSERIRSHLDGCASCSEELRSLREISVLVESHNRELEPRSETWNLIRVQLMAEPAADSAPASWFRSWRLAAAALVAAIIMTLGYVQHREAENRDIAKYMSNYIKQRETLRLTSRSATPYESNPFIKARATVGDNPFRSED